jgi:hypothetical protein
MKNVKLAIWISLFSGWCFDYLFFNTRPGLNFFLFTILALAGGLALVYREKVRIHKLSGVLIALILVFSALFVVRNEPLTNFANLSATLTLLVVLSLTVESGLWPKFGFIDFIFHPLRLIPGIFQGGFYVFTQSGASKTIPEDAAAQPRKLVRFWPVIRGLLLAFPVIFLFTLLLTSADPIFSKELNAIFNLDRWGEYALRGILILVIAYLLAGVYHFSVAHRNDIKLIGLDKPVVSPFLGMTETTIILGSINILFILFVAVQFRYFFGGQANIQVDGFTYAEYAQRGFNELVAVAFLSMLIYSGLCTISRRNLAMTRKLFSTLGAAMFVLVAVILVSAYQRLLLYEGAYGFSRLRTYTHIFIIWMGILLFGLIVLEATNQQRAFAMALLVISLGYALTLNLVNVDGFIAASNIARAENGAALDTDYLYQLSDDAMPAMFASFQSTANPALRSQLGKALACWLSDRLDDKSPQSWVSYNISRAKSTRLFGATAPLLADYVVESKPNGAKYVHLNGVASFCLTNQ